MAYPKNAPHPKLVGDRSTARILACLLDHFEIVSLPFGENQRYDLIADDGKRLWKIQCKTGRLRNGVIWFNSCSSSYHHPSSRSYEFSQHSYYGEADLFGVYCPENQEVYLVPVDEIGKRRGSLRVAATRNSQERRIRWAEPYKLPAVGKKEPSARPSVLFECSPMYAVREFMPG